MELLILSGELYIIFIFVVGVVGHVMTLFILRKKVFAQSITIPFRVVAMMEIILLTLALPRLWAMLYFKGDLGLLTNSPLICTLYSTFVFVCTLIVDWAVVFATATRFVYIAFPLRANRICKTSHVYVSILAIVLANLGYGSVMFLAFLSPSSSLVQSSLHTYTNCLSIWFRSNHLVNPAIRVVATIWPLAIPVLLNTVFNVLIVAIHKRLVARQRSWKNMEMSPVQEVKDVQSAQELASQEIALEIVESSVDGGDEITFDSARASLFEPLGLPLLSFDAPAGVEPYEVGGGITQSSSLKRKILFNIFNKGSSADRHSTPTDVQMEYRVPKVPVTSRKESQGTAFMSQRSYRRQSRVSFTSYRQPLQRVVILANVTFIIFRIPMVFWVIRGERIFDDLHLPPNFMNHEIVFTAVELVLYTHHALLFIIYCCTGKKFRNTLTKSLGKCAQCACCYCHRRI